MDEKNIGKSLGSARRFHTCGGLDHWAGECNKWGGNGKGGCKSKGGGKGEGNGGRGPVTGL